MFWVNATFTNHSLFWVNASCTNHSMFWVNASCTNHSLFWVNASCTSLTLFWVNASSSNHALLWVNASCTTACRSTLLCLGLFQMLSRTWLCHSTSPKALWRIYVTPAITTLRSGPLPRIDWASTAAHQRLWGNVW